MFLIPPVIKAVNEYLHTNPDTQLPPTWQQLINLDNRMNDDLETMGIEGGCIRWRALAAEEGIDWSSRL
jgi:hypothetical protein